jgi:hypothetical protein
MPRRKAISLNDAFGLLERAAVNGERCPLSHGPHASPLKSKHVSALARAGKIFVEISGRNFRRVTILVGPHAGAKTAADPDAGHVYATVGKRGRHHSFGGPPAASKSDAVSRGKL